MATNDNLEKRYIYEYEGTQNLTSLNDITDNKSYKYLCIAFKNILLLLQWPLRKIFNLILFIIRFIFWNILGGFMTVLAVPLIIIGWLIGILIFVCILGILLP